MSKANTKHNPLFVVVSGPSGSGKTTICCEIAARHNWYYSISHTTRKKRIKEIHGVDYFFVSQDEFMTMVEHNDFIEWAKVYENYYGTSKRIIEDKLNQGQSVILDVDTQGAALIKKAMPQAILIFIKPPDIEVLKKRLEARGQDSEAEIEKRLKKTREELERIKIYDHVIINDDLPRAVQELSDFLKKHKSNLKNEA